MIGHAQEIYLRDNTPDTVSSTGTEEEVIKRDFLSERTIFVDAREDVGEGDMERTETMKSVYVDALSGEEDNVEVKESMEVTVVAEVDDGSFTPSFCRHRSSNYLRGRRRGIFYGH